MAQLVLDIVDPNAFVLERGASIWVISGLFEPLAAGFGDRPSDDGESEAALCRDLGDGTIIRLDRTQDSVRRVRIWKGISSGYEVFYALRPNGDVLLADHFRNAMTLIPASERATSTESLIDHYLLRHVPGAGTYVRAFKRAAHGECVDIDVVSRRETRSAFDRLVSSGGIEPIDTWVNRIDAAMSRVLGPLKNSPGLVNMLSGGIDSSLIQTYLGTDVSAVTVVPDTSSFSMGGTRAEMVAKVLGVKERREIVISGDQFLQQTEEAVDARGLPPNFPQWVTLPRIYDTPGNAFVVGERADSLFSREGGRVPLVARHLSTPLGSLFIPLARAVAKRAKLRGFQLLPNQSEWMRRDPLHARGWPSLLALYTDMDLIEDTFGKEQVEKRLAERVEYVTKRAQLQSPRSDRYLRNLEAAQWIVFYDEQIMMFRHVGYAFGKAIHAPFSTAPLVHASLSIPLTHRYSKGSEGKYLLNRLLARRMPQYDTSMRKDHIELPMSEYYRNGPLKGIWDKYEVPEVFTGALRERVTSQWSEMTWTAITYAIWKKRIADNASLTPHKAKVQRTWPIGGQA